VTAGYERQGNVALSGIAVALFKKFRSKLFKNSQLTTAQCSVNEPTSEDWSLEISVGIATGYGLDAPGVGF
jgi:hypothetical protein